MKGIHHEIVQSEPDAMGRRTLLKISIPLARSNTSGQAVEALSNFQSGLKTAFEEVEKLRDNGFPRNVREAHQWANEAAEEDAAALSKPYEMFVVSKGLQQAVNFLENAPAELKHGFEQALNAAFTSGSNFRLAVSRERHLEDLEREIAQAKARKRGRDENRRASREENQDLFKYMLPMVERDGHKVLTVARWAAAKGYGSQTGDPAKDAQANRSRYNRWVSSKEKQ